LAISTRSVASSADSLDPGVRQGSRDSPRAALVDLLNRLDDGHIHYALLHTRVDSVMVDVSLPGSRWEIEFSSMTS
jgi:hypothetical protein